MLPQYMALSVGFVSYVCQKKICVSVRWFTLWVRPPPPVKICVSVRWVTLWVRPPPVKICVSVRWGILWVCPPLRWILACCLLRFAAFFNCLIINVLFEVFRTNICIQAGAELCQAQQSLSYLLAGS